jgi:hypothetical protein
MKTKFLAAAFLLFSATTAVQAQMPKLDADDHKKCLDDCKGLDNSDDRHACIVGCGCKCPNLSRTAINAVPNLTGLFSNKPARQGKVLIHTDQLTKGKTFVSYQNGKLDGYYNTYADGSVVLCPILVYNVGKEKRYYIYDTSGKYLQVKKPDVKFHENVGLVVG